MNNNVLILCAVLAFIFLNGCAATSAPKGTGPWQYNGNTGWQYTPTTGYTPDPSWAMSREEIDQWTR